MWAKKKDDSSLANIKMSTSRMYSYLKSLLISGPHIVQRMTHIHGNKKKIGSAARQWDFACCATALWEWLTYFSRFVARRLSLSSWTAKWWTPLWDVPFYLYTRPSISAKPEKEPLFAFWRRFSNHESLCHLTFVVVGFLMLSCSQLTIVTY